MNLVILVSTMIPPANSDDGRLHAQFTCWTSDGGEVVSSIPVDFNATVVQTNAALIAEAKAAQTRERGVTFLPADKTLIFAGGTIA